MARAEFSLENLSSVLQTYEGRDKTARLVQFASRFVVGLTAQASSRTFLRAVHGDARKLLSAVTSARRTYRIGRELPILLSFSSAIAQPKLMDTALDLAKKATLVMYFLTDHLGWLKQVLRDAKTAASTIQRGLAWLAISSFVSAISGVRHLCVAPDVPSQAGADIRSDLQPQKRREVCVLIFRDCLLAFQALHLARILEVGDSLVGILGMVTSTIDIARVWPVQRYPEQEKAANSINQDESQQCTESEFGEAGSTLSGQTSSTRESFESEAELENQLDAMPLLDTLSSQSEQGELERTPDTKHRGLGITKAHSQDAGVKSSVRPRATANPFATAFS
ncbi:ACTA [Symbiodinium sp. CCMP2592]|nr:ACTA [Symbiodinium sp. CCMP2592]